MLIKCRIDLNCENQEEVSHLLRARYTAINGKLTCLEEAQKVKEMKLSFLLSNNN